MRQRNDTGSVLACFDLDGQARDIGPGEEFDASLPVPGCAPVPAPAKTARAAAEPAKETPA